MEKLESGHGLPDLSGYYLTADLQEAPLGHMALSFCKSDRDSGVEIELLVLLLEGSILYLDIDLRSKHVPCSISFPRLISSVLEDVPDRRNERRQLTLTFETGVVILSFKHATYVRTTKPAPPLFSPDNFVPERPHAENVEEGYKGWRLLDSAIGCSGTKLSLSLRSPHRSDDLARSGRGNCAELIFAELQRARFSRVSHWSTLLDVEDLPHAGEYRTHRLTLSKGGLVEVTAKRCTAVEWRFGA